MSWDALPALLPNYPLQALNTFGIEAQAAQYAHIKRVEELAALATSAVLKEQPWLVLGGGSNVLLPPQVQGLVLHMGIDFYVAAPQQDGSWLVQAGAGMGWHALVQRTLEEGLAGLENLALIPGTVGAAPVQNIGAYGVELASVLHSVQAYDRQQQGMVRLLPEACQLGYRDSLFKQVGRGRYIITSVTLKLQRHGKANLSYPAVNQELASQGIVDPSPQQVGQAVIAIRQRKLPDPAVLGNAGSFFKNPIVLASQLGGLLTQHPGLPSYAQPDGSFKLAAAWLIEQCGWKGYRDGPVGVHSQQALVLVNYGGATAAQVWGLAEVVQRSVQDKFGVHLVPEVQRV